MAKMSRKQLERERQKVERERYNLTNRLRESLAEIGEIEERIARKEARDPKSKARRDKLAVDIDIFHQRLGRLHTKARNLRPLRQRTAWRLTRLARRIKRKLKPRKAEAAVEWAKSQDGVTEYPSGSNWGKPVQDWIKRCGYTSPVPWCGCFVREAVVDHGNAKIPEDWRFGYSGYIADDARAGRNGLSWVTANEVRAGDIAVIGTSHVCLVVGPMSKNVIPTIDGNTSPSSAGSQYNGGCVALKWRPASSYSTFARPRYE